MGVFHRCATAVRVRAGTRCAGEVLFRVVTSCPGTRGYAEDSLVCSQRTLQLSGYARVRVWRKNRIFPARPPFLYSVGARQSSLLGGFSFLGCYATVKLPAGVHTGRETFGFLQAIRSVTWGGYFEDLSVPVRRAFTHARGLRLCARDFRRDWAGARGAWAGKRCLGEGAIREGMAPFLLCVLRN